MFNQLPAKYHDELLQAGREFLVKFHQTYPDLKLGFVLKQADIAQILEEDKKGSTQPIDLKKNKQYELIACDHATRVALQIDPFIIGKVLKEMHPTAESKTNREPLMHFTAIKDKGLFFTLQSKAYCVYDIGINQNGEVEYNPTFNTHVRDFDDYVNHGLITVYSLPYEVYTAYNRPESDDYKNESLKNLAYIFNSFRAQFARGKTFSRDTGLLVNDFFMKGYHHRLLMAVFTKYKNEYQSLDSVSQHFEEIARQAREVAEKGETLMQAQDKSEMELLKKRLAELEKKVTLHEKREAAIDESILLTEKNHQLEMAKSKKLVDEQKELIKSQAARVKDLENTIKNLKAAAPKPEKKSNGKIEVVTAPAPAPVAAPAPVIPASAPMQKELESLVKKEIKTTLAKIPEIKMELPKKSATPPQEPKQRAPSLFDPKNYKKAKLALALNDVFAHQTYNQDLSERLKAAESRLNKIIVSNNAQHHAELNATAGLLKFVSNSEVFLRNARTLARILGEPHESTYRGECEHLLGFIEHYQFDNFSETGKFRESILLEEILTFLQTNLSIIACDFGVQGSTSIYLNEIYVLAQLLMDEQTKKPIADTISYTKFLIDNQKILDSYLSSTLTADKTKTFIKSKQFLGFANALEEIIFSYPLAINKQALRIFAKYSGGNKSLVLLEQCILAAEDIIQKLIDEDLGALALHLRYALLSNNFHAPYDHVRSEQLKNSVRLYSKTNDSERISEAVNLIYFYGETVAGLNEQDFISNMASFTKTLDACHEADDRTITLTALNYLLNIYQDDRLAQGVDIRKTTDHFLSLVKFYHAFIQTNFIVTSVNGPAQTPRQLTAARFLHTLEKDHDFYIVQLQKKAFDVSIKPLVDVEVAALKQAIEDPRFTRPVIKTLFFKRHANNILLYKRVLQQLVEDEVITKEDPLFKLS